MIELGWQNAGGTIEEAITYHRDVCHDLRHSPKETNEGLNGTMHTVSCDECGYVYHYDSGD